MTSQLINCRPYDATDLNSHVRTHKIGTDRFQITNLRSYLNPCLSSNGLLIAAIEAEKV